MRKSGAVLAVLASLLIALVGAGTASAQSSTSPPKNLKLVGDHWTPWDPPPAGPGAYIIQKGDTLWDLAGQWLDDPFLWPQVWDENRYILDSHWIYPGDPLVIPGRPTVVPDTGIPPVDDSSLVPQGEPESLEPVAKPVPVPALLPVADATDIYCSGYIDPGYEASDLGIAGRELEKEFVAQGDVIYINQGRNQGIQAGDEFAIRRETRQVTHPTTRQDLGTFIRRLGKVRVMLTQENTSTAVIEMSCDAIEESDQLVPWEEIPVPRLRQLPEFDRYDVTESLGPDGFLVTERDNLDIVGEGQIIYTDLGVASGVRPGDVLTLYRENGDLPRAMLGQAIILTVEPLTSTAKVMLSVREMKRGDRVEVIQ